jgi:hemerythrin-like metal-binding protein
MGQFPSLAKHPSFGCFCHNLTLSLSVPAFELRNKTMNGTTLGAPSRPPIGIPALDRQHDCLEALLGDFSESLANGFGDAEISRFLSELLLYTSYHFATEEAAMRFRQYRGYERHKRQHDGFRAMIERLAGAADQGLVEPALVVRLVESWLEDHTHRSDLAFAVAIRRMAPSSRRA